MFAHRVCGLNRARLHL